MPLAIAAALTLHLLVVVGSQVGTRPSAPYGLTTSMTVRFVEAAVAAPDLPQVVPTPERSSRLDGQPPATVAGTPNPAAALDKPRSPAGPPSTADRRPVSPVGKPGGADVAATPLSPAEPLAARPSPATVPAAPTLPPAPAYLLGANLDVGPQPIGEIEPEYPESANLQEGKVVVRVLINEAGSVDNVAVLRSAPAGLFEHSALEAFGKARFSPGRAAGVAVKSQITVEVHFLPINRGSRISGRGY